MRTFGLLGVAALAALICCSVTVSPVHAQQERLERYADRIADCFIQRAPEVARRWLGTLPGSREEASVYYRRTGGFEVCADSANVGDVWSTRIGRQRQRELVAAAVLRADYPSLPLALPQQVSTGTWISRQMVGLSTQTHVDRTAVQMLLFGDCLARSQWPAVMRLLQSDRRSEAEREAINELRPHLASCLPLGLTLRIDPQVMRTVVTEPVYHILLDTPADLSRG